MLRHFRLTVRVSYDGETIPSDMSKQLEANAQRTILENGLIGSSDSRDVVTVWLVEAEELACEKPLEACSFPSWSIEELQRKYVFRYVEDENDQLSVCETARVLFVSFHDNCDFLEHFLDTYVEDDEYMGSDLKQLLTRVVWGNLMGE